MIWGLFIECGDQVHQARFWHFVNKVLGVHVSIDDMSSSRLQHLMTHFFGSIFSMYWQDSDIYLIGMSLLLSFLDK